MARTILVLSGKGGSGKTTVATNMATALAQLGKNVALVDGNLTTPNVGLHLGLPVDGLTIHDVIKKEADLLDAIHILPSGLRVVPGSISTDDLKGLNADELGPSLKMLSELDYVIIDGAAGIGREALAGMKAADEVIVVTNPEIPAVTDALKVVRLAEEAGLEVTGLVVNRIKGKKHELSREDIYSLIDVPVIAEIPEDEKIAKSISEGDALVTLWPESKASLELRNLASSFVGRSVQVPWYRRILNSLFG